MIKNLRTANPVQLPNYGIEQHFSTAKGWLIIQTPMENFVVSKDGERFFISSVGTYCQYEKEVALPVEAKAEPKRK